jgi:predicted DNA-binding transcriptional regulator AlpA
MSKVKDPVTNRSERFISRKELARRWGVSTRTIDFRRKEHLLPNPIVLDQKGGRGIRFRLAEIEAYEESLQQRGCK